MKKLCILFFIFNFYSIYTSEERENSITCYVHVKPADRDEIYPSPQELANYDNFLDIIKTMCHNPNSSTTVSSHATQTQKVVRVRVVRHDGTPMILTYLLRNKQKLPNFCSRSIWSSQKTSSMVNEIIDLLNDSDENLLSLEDIARLNNILNGQITDTFSMRHLTPLAFDLGQRRQRSKSYQSEGPVKPSIPESMTDEGHSDEQEPDIIPLPSHKRQFKKPTIARSDSDIETPPLSQYYGQPYYPRKFIPESSPEPRNPNQ